MFFFLWLILLSIIPSKFIHIVANGTILFFLRLSIIPLYICTPHLIYSFICSWILRLLLVFVVQSCLTLCDPTNWSTPGFSVHHYLRVCSNSSPVESVMPSNHLILCCPLFPLSSVFLSISIFSNKSALWMRWPKYWSFSFSISLSNEYSRLLLEGLLKKKFLMLIYFFIN